LILLVVLPLYYILSLYFLDKYYFLCPVEYERQIIIRNDQWGEGHFGARRSGGRKHNGIDLYAEIGAPVFACRSGRVLLAEERPGIGKFVLLEHPYNLRTLYGHLSEISVASNHLVRQGQLIGGVGKTGNADIRAILPHLHLEVRKGGIAQDPMEYLD